MALAVKSISSLTPIASPICRATPCQLTVVLGTRTLRIHTRTHANTNTRRKYQCMRREECVCVCGMEWGRGDLEQLLATFYLKTVNNFTKKTLSYFYISSSSLLAFSLSCVRKEELLHAVYLFTHFLSASNSGHCICLSYSHAREQLCDNGYSLSLSLFVEMTVEFLFLFCHLTYFRFHFH